MFIANGSDSMKTFTRIVSLILVHTFLLSSVVLAAPVDGSGVGDAGRPGFSEKSPGQAAPKEAVTNPENIVIPREFGLVKSKSESKADRLVIHIQDAHCNYEAQSNIVKILEALVKNDQLKLVSVEGADGTIDTSWFKAFPDDSVRKEVADYFMKKGEITGPEFLSITTDLPIKLFGAETRAYYIENLNAFTSSYPLKDETEKYFNTIRAALNKLKGYIYNDDLREMDSKSADYEAKKIQFNDYVRFLQGEAEKNKLNLRSYDNLFKLINVLIYEKKIDFSVTDRERTNLIDELTKKLAKEGITQLVNQSIQFKIGKISSVDYYSYLKALAAANSIDLAKSYPNLYNYIIYNSVYSKIENEKLFGDIKKVETDIKEKLFASDDQRSLERLSRHIDILIGLINIKLLNGDFDYYKANKDAFSIEIFTDFIQKKGAQFGLAIAIDPVTDAVAKSISKLEDFYAIAIKRDKALVDNTLAEMARTGERIAVLVTGGFHSEGITRLLEKQGISYMVVCPSITKDVPTPYIQVLTNQRTSFEDVVMGAAETPAKTMLAPAYISWAMQLDTHNLRQIFAAVSPDQGDMDAALEGTLQGRVERTEREWVNFFVNRWMKRTIATASQKGLGSLIRQESTLKNAFTWAVEHKLDELAASDPDIKARRNIIRDRILSSDHFKAEFHREFEVATRSPASANPAPGAPDGRESQRDSQAKSEANAGEKKAGEQSAGYAEEADDVDSDSYDSAVINKVSGASLTNRVVNRSMSDKKTRFLTIYADGQVPPEIQAKYPQYAAIIAELKQTLGAYKINDTKLKDVLRFIGATGIYVPKKIRDAFKINSIIKALDSANGKGLTIKLVQPKDAPPGLRVPGIAMLRVGSNYGHYSTPASNNTIYIPWGMVDQLLAEEKSSSRNMIVADILHELTEYVILKQLDPKSKIANRNAQGIVHAIAQGLECAVAGAGSSAERSALDDKLAEITNSYYKAYLWKMLDHARAIFNLGYSEVLYVKLMWQQYIDRTYHNRGRETLKIIEDPDVITSSGYTSKQHGNFLLTSMMSDNDTKKLLSMHRLGAIEEDGENAEAARNIEVTANSLDGGIGENCRRLEFLRWLAKEGLISGKVEMGAKGTDLGFVITYKKSKKVFVSLAEAKLLQIYMKLASERTKANKPMFARFSLEPLGNYQSRDSYLKLFGKTCLFDRFGMGQKRTYRQLLESIGIGGGKEVEVRDILEQSDLPYIEKESGDILIEMDRFGKKKWQPGGHGYWGFHILHDAWQTKPTAGAKTQVRVFFNGDNLNSGVSEHIVGAMVRRNWPVVKLVTKAEPIDKKGGKEGVRIIKVGDETMYIPDQMEEADAKDAGQRKEFYTAGLENPVLKKAVPGKQLFNTNIFYINTTLLHNILSDLEKVVGKDAVLDAISPILIAKSKEVDGVEYAPIDGAFGTAITHLNEYFMTSTNPAVKAILSNYNAERILHQIEVPRTEFFTPVKKSFDIWLQADSDFYKELDQTSWTLQDNAAIPPPDVEFIEDANQMDPGGKVETGYAVEDSDPANYWIEYQNYRDSFGNASTRQLRSLKVNGRVILKDAVLIGDVKIVNKKSVAEVRRILTPVVEAKKENRAPDLAGASKELKAIKPIDMTPLAGLKSMRKGGKLVLKNVLITINEDGSVDVKPYQGEKVGAIRMNGGELSAVEHRGEKGEEKRSVNAVIASLIRKGNAHLLLNEGKRRPGDVEIAPFELTPELKEKVSEFLKGLGVNIVVINGLTDNLYEQGVATDLVFHPGVHREAVYLDRGDFNYLLGLPNGFELLRAAVLHEKVHLDDPMMSEEAAEKLAPTYELRMALTMKDVEGQRRAQDIKTKKLREGEEYAPGQVYRKPLARFAKFGTSGVRWLVSGMLARFRSENAAKYNFYTSNGYTQEDFTVPNVALVAKSIAIYNLRKALGIYRPVVTDMSSYEFKKRLFEKGMLVMYDNRPGNEEFAKEVARVLAAYGIKATLAFSKVDGEFMPTPLAAVSLLIKKEGYAGSIYFTASHNGDEWDGVKFNTEDGAPSNLAVTTAVGSILKEELGRAEPSYDYAADGFNDLMATTTLNTIDTTEYYVDAVMRYMGRERVAAVRKAVAEGRVTLKYSAFYGSSARVMQRLFMEFGLPASGIIETEKASSNTYVESYEPTLERLTALNGIIASAMKAKEAQVVLGGAADNDADRFQVNENGTEYGPSTLTPVLGHYLVTSRGLTAASLKWGRSFVSSANQDNVAKLLGQGTEQYATGFKYSPPVLANSGIIYSEESYGLSFWDWTLDKDGIMPAILALELVATTGKSLHEYEAALKAQLRDKGIPADFTFGREDRKLSGEVKENAIARFKWFFFNIEVGKTRFAGKTITKIYNPAEYEGGMKFEMEGGIWVALRSSGTEPLIRLYREGNGLEETERLKEALRRLTGLSAPETIEDNAELAAGTLNVAPQTFAAAFAENINKTTLLNDIAESVGIKKEAALKQMAASGIAKVTDETKGKYELSADLYNIRNLKSLRAALVRASDNPKLVDLTVLRLERIMLNSVNVQRFSSELGRITNTTPEQVMALLKTENAFPTLVATWELEAARASKEKAKPVALKVEDLTIPTAADMYKKEGVAVEFSLPRKAEVNPMLLAAVKEYNVAIAAEMARGAYNYRGTGTRQTVEQFYKDYFVKEWRGKIQDFVRANFTTETPLKAIVTNGIGANDQFMWSLVLMYNQNAEIYNETKPKGMPSMPEWHHVTTARGFMKLAERRGLKGANTLFIDISRSGTTWEGIEVAMRSLALESNPFNKRIAIANGGALVDIAKAAAKMMTSGESLIINMSPDIGGRNMHRKTSIYYTAQTVAGMFMPQMESAWFAQANDKFDRANDFASPESSLPVSAGRFLFGAMRLLGVDHIALITNSEPLRLIGTEWEQYIMEGSNKEDIISLGIHDLRFEKEHVLANLAASPAGKHSIGMALLDMASPDYEKELARVNKLKETMPMMVFTINSSTQTTLKGGMDVNTQAAFDILWTDMVTVFTSLLRVDANSNPNVKVVREMTAKRVADWSSASTQYAGDAIGIGTAKTLMSYGSPVNPEIGVASKQQGLNPQNAVDEARKLAKKLAEAGLLKGRNRLNIFAGREDLAVISEDIRSRAYQGKLSTGAGWIIQIGLFPIWSHKGLEANLAHSTNPERPLLADKTVNIFLNARQLASGNELNEQKFDNMGIMEEKYGAINGATVHQTNDAMTMPNIKRMAEVSPTVLIEFNDTDDDIKETITKFVDALVMELAQAVEDEKKAAATRKEKQGGESVGTPGEGTSGGRPEAVKPKGVEQSAVETTERAMTERERQVYERYVRADIEALRETLVSVSASDQKIRKPVILVYDTGIEPNIDTSSVARAGEAAINRYLDDMVIEVRGTGVKLLEKVQQAVAEYRSKNITNYEIVSIVSDDTIAMARHQLALAGKSEENLKEKLGAKIINVKSNGERYIPIIALYDAALRWAYGINLTEVADRLSALRDGNTPPITVDDLMKGMVRFLPRIGPVSMAEAVEAYKAAQQALQSL